jgi:hypothetical protein
MRLSPLSLLAAASNHRASHSRVASSPLRAMNALAASLALLRAAADGAKMVISTAAR